MTVADIAEPAMAITVTSPNGGEIWTTGSRQYITWDFVGVNGYVSIELSTDGGAQWNTLAYLTYNDGSYAWTVTNVATHARIKVVSLSDTSVFGISNATFTIQKSGISGFFEWLSKRLKGLMGKRTLIRPFG